MVNGLDEVMTRLESVLDNAQGTYTERTLTEMLITAGGYAADITPVATSTLINSQDRQVTPTLQGMRGVLYYGAQYAPYVHDAPGTLKGTQTPRYPRSDGFVWDPNGEPEFLRKGMDRMLRDDADAIIERNYTP